MQNYNPVFFDFNKKSLLQFANILKGDWKKIMAIKYIYI